MYFPTLNTLKNYHHIDTFIIRMLDTWLGTRRQAIKKFLDPIQFSIDTDIDEELSISLFADCTHPKINVLKKRYTVECPQCGKVLGVYFNPNEVPITIFCNECNHNYPVTFDNIIIWFELIKLPEQSQDVSPKRTLIKEGTQLGKSDGLRPSRITNPSMARRLLDGLDERIRSS
jgi:hypothetical protein